MYQVYDITDNELTWESISFTGAKEFMAEHWDPMEDEQDERVFYEIMNVETLDQLNNYAAGLGYIIERMGE